MSRSLLASPNSVAPGTSSAACNHRCPRSRQVKVISLADVLRRLGESRPSDEVLQTGAGLPAATARAAWECLLPRLEPEMTARLTSGAVLSLHRSLEWHLARTSEAVLPIRPPPGRRFLIRQLNKFPCLAQVWETQVNGWATFALDFLSDAEAFCREQALAGRPSCFEDLDFNLSDPHREGRAVIRVRFANGAIWYYKPRSGEPDAAWSDLLLKLNEAGFKPSFILPGLRLGRRHHWMARVSSQKCKSISGVQQLTRRLGALLYLAQAFRAVDLHMQNVILRGQHPVIIDAETFFHPATKIPSALRSSEDCVSRTGLQSCLGLTEPQRCCRARRAALIDGFTAAHEFMSRHCGNPHIRSAIQRLHRAGTRLIFRPTTLYVDLLRRSLSPEFMTCASKRTRFLHSQLNDGLCSEAIIQCEVKQLSDADIPIFHGRPSRLRFVLNGAQFTRAEGTLRAWCRRSAAI